MELSIGKKRTTSGEREKHLTRKKSSRWKLSKKKREEGRREEGSDWDTQISTVLIYSNRNVGCFQLSLSLCIFISRFRSHTRFERYFSASSSSSFFYRSRARWIWKWCGRSPVKCSPFNLFEIHQRNPWETEIQMSDLNVNYFASTWRYFFAGANESVERDNEEETADIRIRIGTSYFGIAVRRRGCCRLRWRRRRWLEDESTCSTEHFAGIRGDRIGILLWPQHQHTLDIPLTRTKFPFRFKTKRRQMKRSKFIAIFRFGKLIVWMQIFCILRLWFARA